MNPQMTEMAMIILSLSQEFRLVLSWFPTDFEELPHLFDEWDQWYHCLQYRLK